MNDLVINSYKDQIKQSLLKAQAVKIAGFDIIIDEITKRGVDCTGILAFFNKMESASTKEQIDMLTVDELQQLVDDINLQVTRSLISAMEVAGVLKRKSMQVALERSPNGKVTDEDNYVKVGVNLASEISKHGISHGISICVKNYCIQKMYQATYKEKIKEREKKLGIYEEKVENNSLKRQEIVSTNHILKEIFHKNIEKSSDDFVVAKENYFRHLEQKLSMLAEYK